jgi:hypothetical protein
MPVELSIQRRPPGIHDETIKDGMAIIRTELDLAGLDGIFSARPNRQLNLKGNQRVRLGIYSNEQRHVTMKIKPGHNGTAWEWAIYPPSSLRPETVHKLLSLSGRLNEPKELIPTTKPRFEDPPPVEFIPEEKPVMPEPEIKEQPAPAPSVKTVEEATGLGLQELAAALGLAAKARERYKEREAKLAQAKIDLDEAELMLLAAQETHEKAKKLHDRLRAEHADDKRGRTSMEILTQFKSIVG